MNKMLILLEQLHLENDVRQLKNANIDRVVVNADNSYVFYVSASHIVPLEEIRKLFSAKNEFPYPSDFVFDWMSSYTAEDVQDYAMFILNGLKAVSYTHLDVYKRQALGQSNLIYTIMLF